jgi:hypothetical protein
MCSHSCSSLQLLHNLAAPGSVEVRSDAGGKRGKGLFAKKAFKKGDAIFQERPLVSSADSCLAATCQPGDAATKCCCSIWLKATAVQKLQQQMLVVNIVLTTDHMVCCRWEYKSCTASSTHQHAPTASQQ